MRGAGQWLLGCCETDPDLREFFFFFFFFFHFLSHSPPIYIYIYIYICTHVYT